MLYSSPEFSVHGQNREAHFSPVNCTQSYFNLYQFSLPPGILKSFHLILKNEGYKLQESQLRLGKGGGRHRVMPSCHANQTEKSRQYGEDSTHSVPRMTDHRNSVLQDMANTDSLTAHLTGDEWF